MNENRNENSLQTLFRVGLSVLCWTAILSVVLELILKLMFWYGNKFGFLGTKRYKPRDYAKCTVIGLIIGVPACVITLGFLGMYWDYYMKSLGLPPLP